MKIEVVSKTIPELRFQPPRSEGLHLSTIIADIAIQMGFFEDKPLNPVRGALGFAWELYLENSWCIENGVYRPGEVVCDGIAGSPDGLGTDDEGHFFLGEYKHTWYSTNKNFEDMWYFQAQTKSYCWMLSASTGDLVDTVRMPVAYVNGDYKHPYEPEYADTKITYTFDELHDNWRMITSHAVAQGWLEKSEIRSFD